MLKIKDEINLKELEKFGFQQGKEDCYNFIVKKDYIVVGINVNENKEIYCNNCALDLLFDLISAGLVEKVVEDE